MTEGQNDNVFALLPHPSASRILILASDAGWSLPSTKVTGQIELTPCLATREMVRKLDFPVLAYRYARINVDEGSGRQEGIFAFDGLENVPTLQGPSRWVSREDLAELRLNRPDHRDVIDDYLRELETGIIPKFRQPWEHRGWFALATSWIRETLGSLGIQVMAPPEQVRWWSLSCVLRVTTVGEDVYFKTSARQPFFANEPVLLEYLARRYPAYVPTVLSTDLLNGWMLLKNAGPTLGKNLLIEQRRDMLQVFGGLQRDTAQQVEPLLALGCADRRPHRLIPHIEPLLNDELAVSKLATDEVAELRREAPRIAEICSRISDYAVPSTLIHGDLHPDNIAITAGKPIFFDWTEACIAHPFMDMFMIFNERDESLHTQLRDAYLAIWTEFEQMGRLLELWSLCGVAHAIHHAFSYQSVLRHTERRSRGELEAAPPFLLRKALRYLHELE